MNKKKLFKRAAAIFLLAVIAIPLILVNQGQTKTQPYYSGDAILYRGQLVFATANSGYLEVFKVNGQEVETLVKIKDYNPTFNSYNDYSAVKLVIENSDLYVYASSQYTLFKYDFSELSSLELVKKIKNNYWDWYRQIDKFGDNIVLMSDKGVRVLNADLDVIDSYTFTGAESYSIINDKNNARMLGIGDSKIKIFNKSNRQVAKEIALNFTSSDNNHKAYLDTINNQIFAIDDYYAKKFDAESGKLLASFRHLDAAGYDMVGSAGNDSVYFSNGFGVVRMTKDNFEVADFTYTSMIAGPQGWAMGLKLVETGHGDMLVVFNGSNIVVLNSALDKVAAIKASESADNKPQEDLYLNLDKTSALTGETVNLTGGGFWTEDKLQILLGGTEIKTVTTDKNGRFDTDLVIPDVLKKKQDIKVNSLNSKLTYSIGFEVK